MLAASFVPPPPIRVLRDLTRARSTVTQHRAIELQRLEKYPKNTGSKLSSVVSDLDGVSSKLTLHALPTVNATHRRWQGWPKAA